MSAENALNGKVGEVGMIQIDIPMPKNCGVCPICNEYLMCAVPCNGRGWGENDVSDYFANGRPEWCPMTEQPQIVRCKDCKECYFASNRIQSEQTFACGKHGIDVTQDWFCADGRRRTE